MGCALCVYSAKLATRPARHAIDTLFSEWESFINKSTHGKTRNVNIFTANILPIKDKSAALPKKYPNPPKNEGKIESFNP